MNIKKKQNRKAKTKFMPLICVLMLLVPNKIDFGYELLKSIDGTEYIKLMINIT